jgi:hypothetical protein
MATRLPFHFFVSPVLLWDVLFGSRLESWTVNEHTILRYQLYNYPPHPFEGVPL